MCCQTRRPRRQWRWTSLTCMDSSFQVLTRAGHPWRGTCLMGLIDAGRTPPTVGCRTRETEGDKEDAARPRACPVLDTGVIRRGNRLRGLLLRGAASLRFRRRSAHGRKTQLAQGAERHWGRAARREAASLLSSADRRMVRRLPCNIRCKPAHVEGAA